MAEQADTPVEDVPSDDPSELVPFRYFITSYGADYPVDGLVKRIAGGDIFIPPFQRSYVWTLSQASSFIESLLLGLPVPGIFLSKDDDSQKLLVIDGQQRLRTLQYFYEGVFEPSKREFALKGVPSRFEGSTYRSLAEEDRRRLDDSILHATIVRQDEPSEDKSSIYHIFERLNTGGTPLHPQEIRTCIYYGPFSDLLKALNDTPTWRSVFGPVSTRMKDQELILRFLALYFNGETYRPPLKGFMNDFMGANRYLRIHSADILTRTFVPTIEVIHRALGDRAFRPKRALNAALFDAITVALARRLDRGPVKNATLIRERYDGLLVDEAFVASIETGTTHEDNVVRRITKATEAFADVE